MKNASGANNEQDEIANSLEMKYISLDSSLAAFVRLVMPNQNRFSRESQPVTCPPRDERCLKRTHMRICSPPSARTLIDERNEEPKLRANENVLRLATE